MILGLVLVAVAAAAGGRGTSVTTSGSEDGDDLQITVSKALALGLLEGAVGSTLDCDGTVDSDFRNLLQALDRGGRNARATLRNHDAVIEARRRGRTLKMDIRDLDDGGRIGLVMPWAVAECLLGRDVFLDRSAAKVKVRFEGPNGGTFEFKVD